MHSRIARFAFGTGHIGNAENVIRNLQRGNLDMIRRMRKEDLGSVKSLMQSIPNFWHAVWGDEILERAFSASAEAERFRDLWGSPFSFAL